MKLRQKFAMFTNILNPKKKQHDWLKRFANRKLILPSEEVSSYVYTTKHEVDHGLWVVYQHSAQWGKKV